MGILHHMLHALLTLPNTAARAGSPWKGEVMVNLGRYAESGNHIVPPLRRVNAHAKRQISIRPISQRQRCRVVDA